jgi:hypothetical protein
MIGITYLIIDGEKIYSTILCHRCRLKGLDIMFIKPFHVTSKVYQICK